MFKAKIGSVGIESVRGKYRLRLPRTVVAKSRYLFTGLEINPQNLKKVQFLSLQIEDDILSEKFDCTLDKYRILPSSKTTTSSNLLQLWDEFCLYQKPFLAETTYIKDYLIKYRNHIASLPRQDLSSASAIEIRNYLIANKSPDTARRVLMYLNSCCNWAIEQQLIKENPFSKAKRIKVRVEKEIDPFSIAERDAILATFKEQKPYYYPFVLFLFSTGCRLGEAIALQWQHVSSDCTQIRFEQSYYSQLKIRKDTKTHKSRNFPCNDGLRQLLLEIKPVSPSPCDSVFTTPTGKLIDNIKFNRKIWKGDSTHKGIVSELVRVGLVKRYRYAYNCRHTFITLCLFKGVPVQQVSRWVGSSAATILKHYAGAISMEVPEL
jgi:integrase